MDGLAGFSAAIDAVFPGTIIQKCVIHQIRNSTKYLASQDYKPFMADLKKVYQAPNLEVAASQLENLDKMWGSQYPLVIRSWRKNWAELTTTFQFPAEIRRLIYTTDTVEGYNRQIRKVIKTKGGSQIQNPCERYYTWKLWTLPKNGIAQFSAGEKFTTS